MNSKKHFRTIATITSFALLTSLAACGAQTGTLPSSSESKQADAEVTKSPSVQTPIADGTQGNIFKGNDSDSSDNTAGSDTELAATPAPTPVPVKAFDGKSITFSGVGTLERNQGYQKVSEDLNEAVGMTINWKWTEAKSYKETLAEQLRTGNVADIVLVEKTDTFLEAVENGMFWDLSPYLDQYENLAIVQDVFLHEGYYKGKLYGIPFGDNAGYALTYRSDWLENMKLDAPVNWEKFCEMLRAFTYNDPDGNGKDDTVGLYLSTNEKVWDFMEAWFGVPNVWGLDENGDLIHKTRTPEYRQAYAAFRELYEQGLMNNGVNGVAEFRMVKEFSTIYMGGLSKGICGTAIDELTYANEQHRELVRKEIVAEGDTIYGVLPYVDTGLGGLCYPEAGLGKSVGWRMLAVSTRRIQTEEQLHQVLQVLNELHSPECATLLINGWEGITYSVDEDGSKRPYNGTSSLKELEILNTALFRFRSALIEGVLQKNNLFPAGNLNLNGKVVDANEFGEVRAQYAVYNYGQQFSSPTEKEKGYELDMALQEAEWQYIAGEIDDAGFEAALNAWWENGGELITQELNEQYHAAGY